MKTAKIWIVQTLCDFGLWVLSLGPKDDVDRENARMLREHWRRAEAQKRTA
jgi:hypothetical protein